MKIVNLTQGTPEWLAHRAQHDNASDAPAMLGCSPHKSRDELVRELATGLRKEFDANTQRRMADGHRTEALFRPKAETIVGEDLYPVVGVSGRYSASFDGLTLMHDAAFEHKALNDRLRKAFAAMQALPEREQASALPLDYRAQMEHQCMVAGCERVLFAASSWEGDRCTEWHQVWYYPDAELRALLIAGWEKLRADVAAYVPTEAPQPAQAAPMETLPAVSVRLDGALQVAGNLPSFAEALRAFVAKIPARPANDDEFATVDAACKALKKAEEALDAAESGALASITDVEAMRRMVAECRKLARDTRLASEKLVERRKQEIKEGAIVAARAEFDRTVAEVNATIAPMGVAAQAPDFAGAIKGLRSIASMQEALDRALLAGRVAVEQAGRSIRANLEAFKAATGDNPALQALFADLHQLVHKPAADFAQLVEARIATHRANEAAREARRQAEEAERIAAAERRAREEEQQRIAAQQAAEAAARAADAALEAVKAQRDQAPVVAPVQTLPLAAVASAPRIAPAADEPATLNLGEICGRFDTNGGIKVTRAFLSMLGVEPLRIERGISYYTESQFRELCGLLAAHVASMATLYGAEVVA